MQPSQSDLSQGRIVARGPSDEDSDGLQLDTAISSFLKRVSVNLQDPGNSVKAVKIRPQPAPIPSAEIGETQPSAPRHAAETADVLGRLRDVARMNADEAIGVHALNQMIAQAKRRMWIASLSILATCGFLQVPWQQHLELNIAIAITFSVAVASTLSYFIVTGRLHRKLISYQSMTSAERCGRSR